VTPAESVEGSREHGLDYGMVDRKVIADSRLCHLDVRVYSVLATCRKGNTVKVGTRLIAKTACVSLRKVSAALRRLADAGHIKITHASPLARTEYTLTYWRFNLQSPQEGMDQQAIALIPEMKICGRCQRRCKQLLKAGYCRSCNWKQRVRNIAREEIEAVRTA
jgi:hypothetical protein